MARTHPWVAAVEGGVDVHSPSSRPVRATPPSPAFALDAGEECRPLLGLLSDGDLPQVAVRKMEGYTMAESLSSAVQNAMSVTSVGS
jgi:hypothetical protein